MKKSTIIEAPVKAETGIEGFDYLTLGGLTKGRNTLVVGTSGSGKTLLGVEYIYKAITEFNQSGIFITFEERPEDIMRNVFKLGWDLNQLVSDDQLRFIDGSPEPNQQEEIGSYDLSGLFVQIEHFIKEVDAKVLVIDSIGSLFTQFKNQGVIRSEIFRIINFLRDLGITSIMTAERLDEYGPITRFGIEEFVSDNVIVLRNVLDDEKCRRTIQILKMRGNKHLQGEFPFTISDEGISIFPLASIELKQESSLDKVGTGNEELDKMTHGGIFRDSILLVSGPTGGGKTLMGTMFAAESCGRGEKVLILAYEESREQLLRNAQSWGLEFKQWEKEGLLRIICKYPESMGLEDHLLSIRNSIKEFEPKRLIMDSVSAMERVASVKNFREFVIGLTSFVKQERICSLLTSTTPQLSGGESVTEAHISTITDVIVLLRYVELHGFLRRGIAVIKMRGSQHEKQVREFEIDHTGLNIGKPFKNVENIILGTASSTSIPEMDNLGDMFSK